MKIKFLLLIVVLLFVSSCAKETEISGNVFIVTKESSNIQLGAIEIFAIPEASIKKHIEDLNSASDSAYDEYKIKSDYCTNAEYPMQDYIPHFDGKSPREQCFDGLDELRDNIAGVYFVNLPTYTATAQTDSNGQFLIKLPKTGKYAIAAKGTINSDGKVEKYYWLIWVNADGDFKRINLSNNNTIYSPSFDQVLTSKLAKQ